MTFSISKMANAAILVLWQSRANPEFSRSYNMWVQATIRYITQRGRYITRLDNRKLFGTPQYTMVNRIYAYSMSVWHRIYIYIYIYMCVCVCVCATSVRQWPTNFANFAVSPAAIRSGVYGFSCCYTAVILVLKQTQCDKGVSRIRQSQRRIAICFRQSVSDNTFPQLNYYYSSIMHGCFCLSCATRTLNKL